MRKCGTCSQSVGHLECTRGKPSQCEDCATPSHQTGISSSTDKDVEGTSYHGNSDSSEEGGESNSNVESRGLDDDCCVCRAKLASGGTSPSDSNTSPVTELDMFSERHQTPKMSSEKSSSCSYQGIKAEELVARSAGQEGLSAGNVSPSTRQTVNVRRKLNFSNSGCIKGMAAHNTKGSGLCMQPGRHSDKDTRFDMPLPAAKRAKTEPRPAVDLIHLSRRIPVIKINKLKAEDIQFLCCV